MPKPRSSRHWHIEHSQPVLNTPYFYLRKDAVRLPNDRRVPDYYVVESRHVVGIFAVTLQQEVLLVEQYKHGWGDVIMEVPAGMSETDDPLADAQRELLEETGYTAPRWELLGRFIASPTRANNEVALYMAWDAEQTAQQSLDANEDITVHRVPLSQIRDYITDGRVRVLDSVLAIQQGLARLGV